MTRDELLAENARLRAALAEAGIDARRIGDQHRSDLAASRVETREANQRTDKAHADAREAGRAYERQTAGAVADLTSSPDLVAQLRRS